MTATPAKHGKPTLAAVRCAVYTRKSTKEGLEQAFNSLDAQREAAEAYVRSQAHEGWALLPERYDDGGCTGGNLDRPALKRLLAAVEQGKVDVVVIYKVDRLSRSLLDFARLMALFERHRVSFVSVTQQFNTATSMGRLMLNVLLSFAQFERELISERTRDKVAATRRKGKWAGGTPLLGYDVDPHATRLVVNADEAIRVRAIFDLYLEHEALLPVVDELARRGWANKRWTTRQGRTVGGAAFTRTSLHRLLTNPAYAGHVRHKGALYRGEHAALVDEDVYRRVQALLQRNARQGGAPVRNQFGALLKGLLRCSCCDAAMTPAHTAKGGRRYRYYSCVAAQKRERATCPAPSVPAAEVERVVVARLREAGRDPAVLTATVAAARRQDELRLAEFEAERRTLERDLAGWHDDERRLARPLGTGEDDPALGRVADLQERIRLAEDRLFRVREQVALLRKGWLAEEDVALALTLFDPIWQELAPAEQARVVRLLVRRVDYDGKLGKLRITFHETGLQVLADEVARRDAQEQRA
jgi:site-specific DNA recombinase